PLTIPSLSTALFFYCAGHHRDLHSFPTRRSSDLYERGTIVPIGSTTDWPVYADETITGQRIAMGAGAQGYSLFVDADALIAAYRSEEHTSELQSRENLVCRLLLEKKKKKTHKRRA